MSSFDQETCRVQFNETVEIDSDLKILDRTVSEAIDIEFQYQSGLRVTLYLDRRSGVWDYYFLWPAFHQGEKTVCGSTRIVWSLTKSLRSAYDFYCIERMDSEWCDLLKNKSRMMRLQRQVESVLLREMS